MKTYTPVNLKEKAEFEKKYQLPYGYNNAEIFFSIKDAIEWCYKSLGPNEIKEWVIEEHLAGFTDIVFRWDII